MIKLVAIALALSSYRCESAFFKPATKFGHPDAGIQLGWPDRHIDAFVYHNPPLVTWMYWKGDEGASFGHEWADGSIIAYGYWPNCRWNQMDRNITPVPYCGWKQSGVRIQH